MIDLNDPKMTVPNLVRIFNSVTTGNQLKTWKGPKETLINRIRNSIATTPLAELPDELNHLHPEFQPAADAPPSDGFEMSQEELAAQAGRPKPEEEAPKVYTLEQFEKDKAEAEGGSDEPNNLEARAAEGEKLAARRRKSPTQVDESKVSKHPARLARGTETEMHSRKAVEDARRDEAKAAKPTKKPKKEKPAKASKKDKGSKKPKATKPTRTDTFTLADLARELGISPKVARAKLRRKKNVPAQVGESWTFANSDRSAVRKLLKGD